MLRRRCATSDNAGESAPAAGVFPQDGRRVIRDNGPLLLIADLRASADLIRCLSSSLLEPVQLPATWRR
jgi:hypothetical protein